MIVFKEIDTDKSYIIFEKIYLALAEMMTSDQCLKNDLMIFFYDWHNHHQGKRKLVYMLEDGKIIAFVRLWQSPFLAGKNLLTGLETAPDYPSVHIDSLLSYAVNQLGPEVYTQLHELNTNQLRIYEGVGFKKLKKGCFNPYGEWRDNHYLFAYTNESLFTK